MDENKLPEKKCREDGVYPQNAAEFNQAQRVNQQNDNTQGDSAAVAINGTASAEQFAQSSNVNIQAASISQNNQGPLSQNFPVVVEYCCYPGDVLAALKKPLNLTMDKNTGKIFLNGKNIEAKDLGEEILNFIRN